MAAWRADASIMSSNRHGGGNPVGRPTRNSGTDVPPVLPSIPLSAEPAHAADQSIGGLVKDVTTHLSSLVRSEVELARSEVTSEVKKGLQGSIFFIVALVIVLFSLFFFFFTVAAVIAIWLPVWAAFAITLRIMVPAARLLGPPRYLPGPQN